MNMKYITNKSIVAIALAMSLVVSQHAFAYADPVYYPVYTQQPTPQTNTQIPGTGYADVVIPAGAPSNYPTIQYYTPTPGTGYSDPVIPGNNASQYNGGSQNNNNNQSAFGVITISGSSTNTTTANLYGSWSNATGLQTTTWFEYGTSAGSLINQTSTRTQYLNSGNFSDTVTGLFPGTLYYYRAVAQSNGNISYGLVRTLRTQSNAVVANTTPIVRGTTSNSASANTISTLTTPQVNTLDNANVCSGDIVNFTLNYQNTTGNTITNAVLVATLPQGIDYTSSTASATFDQSNRTITVFIGTLAKDQTGIVYVQGKANSLVNGVQNVATRVDFNYVKADGTSATTTNYIMHSGAACNNLGANALSSGFLPTSFGGWLLLVILICAIIFVARKYFAKKEDAHGAHH